LRGLFYGYGFTAVFGCKEYDYCGASVVLFVELFVLP